MLEDLLYFYHLPLVVSAGKIEKSVIFKVKHKYLEPNTLPFKTPFKSIRLTDNENNCIAHWCMNSLIFVFIDLPEGIVVGQLHCKASDDGAPTGFHCLVQVHFDTWPGGPKNLTSSPGGYG